MYVQSTSSSIYPTLRHLDIHVCQMIKQSQDCSYFGPTISETTYQNLLFGQKCRTGHPAHKIGKTRFLWWRATCGWQMQWLLSLQLTPVLLYLTNKTLRWFFIFLDFYFETRAKIFINVWNYPNLLNMRIMVLVLPKYIPVLISFFGLPLYCLR